MAAMKSKQFEEDAAVKVHRIRITLTSRNVKNLEKGAPRPLLVSHPPRSLQPPCVSVARPTAVITSTGPDRRSRSTRPRRAGARRQLSPHQVGAG